LKFQIDKNTQWANNLKHVESIYYVHCKLDFHEQYQ